MLFVTRVRRRLQPDSREIHRCVTTASVQNRSLLPFLGEDFSKGIQDLELRTRRWRRLGGCWRFTWGFCRCSRSLRCGRRFRSRSRTGCFSRRWRARGCWGCRGFGCLRLLLARRKERGTGQNADVFFHSVNWKRHIALTD